MINRGLAKRPLFEDRIDIRYFLSRIAREVRKGRIELHAWCVLATHFHLLVRSPVGELSEALRQAQNEYSRFFNRRHRRDGTLVRGRFFSKPVTSVIYRRILVRYIDANAVKAGLASAPWHYPWGSASQYVFRQGPAWLERAWIESAGAADTRYSGEEYIRTFGGSLDPGAERLVECRLRSTRPTMDELDSLVGSAPSRVLEWMRRKAALADGGQVGLPVCDPRSIHDAVLATRGLRGSWEIKPNGQARSAWDVLEVGLLRALSGSSWRVIASMTRSPVSTCQRRHAVHARLLGEDAVYGTRAAEVTVAALNTCARPAERVGMNG